MLNYRSLKITSIFLLFFSLSSCFRDVEMERTKEIKIGPTIMMDLMKIDLSSEFVPAQEEVFVVKHEIDLDYQPNNLGDKLESLILQFEYLNSLTRTLKTHVIFYSGNQQVTNFNFTIFPGSPDTPNADLFPKLLEGMELDAVERSTRMVIKMEISPGDAQHGGKLDLKAKAFYKFEL